jgi:chitinase
MTKIVPYSYCWVSDSYIISSLAKAYSMGVKAAKFAFVIADGNAVAKDLTNNLSDILEFMKLGGDLVISFGGSDATMIDAVITNPTTLYNTYFNIIKQTNCFKFDFDLEGGNESQVATNNLRNQVLVKLQKTYPSLSVSFTLAGYTSGLPSAQLKVVQDAISAGVNISLVNMMLMDNNFVNPGQDSVTACEALFTQLQKLYPGKSSSNIYAMMSPCTMPGKDDQNTYFQISDALVLAKYCKTNNVGQISYWALQRDVVGPTDYNMASLVNTTNLEFYNTFVSNTNQTSTIPATTSSTTSTSTSTTVNTTKPVVGTVFLGTVIQQDQRTEWIKIDNVVCGNSAQYGYTEIKNNVGDVLDKYVTDSHAVVVNYNWDTGYAYIKSGFSPSTKNDCSNDGKYTAYIKKSAITGNPF